MGSRAAAGENPNGFSVVVLAGIDVNKQLGLALFNRRPTKQSRRQKKDGQPLAASCAVRCSYFS